MSSAIPVASISLPHDGGEFRVNTTTANEQYDTAITRLSDGGFLVIWSTSSSAFPTPTNVGEIRAQRYGADGQPAGAEFKVNTTGAGFYGNPTVTLLAGGGLAIAWMYNDTNILHVQAQIFDASGNRVGNEFQANSAPLSSAYGFGPLPSIVALANGGFALAWQYTVGPFDIDLHARIFGATGTPSGGEFLVNTTTTRFQGPPELVATSNGFVAIWQDNSQNNGNSNIFAQRYDSSGARIGGEFTVNTTIGGSHFGASVTALTNGGLVVVWSGNGVAGTGAYFQRYDANGAPVGVETAIAGGAQEVVGLPGGGFIVTSNHYDTDGSTNNVYAQRFNADGTTHGSAFLVNTTTSDMQENAQIAVLPTGEVVATWRSYNQDGDGWGVYGQRFADDIHTTAGQAFDLKGMMKVVDDGGVGAQETVVISVSYGILNIDGGQPNGSGVDITGSGTGAVTLHGSLAAINALLGTYPASTVQYVPTGGSPPAGATLTMTVTDADNQTSTTSQPITIAPDIHAPLAQDDAFAITENDAIQSGNLFVDHGHGADVAPPGQSLSIAAVNGVAANVGQAFLLASGATLTVRADGTFDYNPNNAFKYLPAAGSGASNLTAADSFSYSLTNGNSATVTITVSGLDSDDILFGTPGNDTLSGGAGRDEFHAGSGNDFINVTGSDYVAGEVYDGGAGADELTFFSTGSIDISTAVISGIETLRYSSQPANATLSLTLAQLAGFTSVHASPGITLTTGGTITLSGKTLDGPINLAPVDTIFDMTGVVTAYLPIVVNGNSGNDTLIGSASVDHLSGGDGNDSLVGGGGADTLIGGAGDDIYTVSDSSTVIVEAAGGGNDTVKSSVSYALGAGVEVETARLIGTANINLTGNAIHQVLIGNTGNNVLDGGGGGDRMKGGSGDDTYIVRSAADTIVEVAGEGDDTVKAAVSYMLGAAAQVEHLYTLDANATTAIDLTGNDYSHDIQGNAGVNVLTGGSGNDTLSGNGGADTLIGGAGDDIYVVTDAATTIIESAGGGNDTIKAFVSYVLGAGVDVETSRLIGSANLNLTGNADHQILIGNTGSNVIDGGGGGDRMKGGAGDDTYVVRSAADTIVEVAGDGNDSVKAAVSYTLGAAAQVEHLLTIDASATTAIDLTGNDYSHDIQGNAGANVLTGGSGDDVLKGFGGNDTLIGGGGADRFVFDHGTGQDSVGDFVSGSDKLDLSAFGFASFAAVQAATHDVGGSAVIDLGGGDSVTLSGVLTAQLQSGDVIISGGGGQAPLTSGMADVQRWIATDATDHVTKDAMLDPHFLAYAAPTSLPMLDYIV